MKPPPLPHHTEAHREVDAWTDRGIQYRLVERGGNFRVEEWDRYRFVPVEIGRTQVLSRRIAGLLHSQKARGGADVLPMAARKP